MGKIFVYYFTSTKLHSEVECSITHNGGDWRSKSLALPLMVSTTLDGFYFANCVLSAALLSDY